MVEVGRKIRNREFLACIFIAYPLGFNTDTVTGEGHSSSQKIDEQTPSTIASSIRR